MKLSRQRKIAEAVQMACLLEASSEKPGSVTPTQSFDDLCYTDFLHCAVILGRVFGKISHKKVGEIILSSVRQCRAPGRSNANLGIILLMAPMARAFCKRGKLDNESLKSTLMALTVEDTEKTFEAIRLADPGGLGVSPTNDVRKKPKEITLLRAMKQAALHDWIAHEYASGYEITLNVGAPELEKNINSQLSARDAVTQTFLKLLYLYPDSHVARKTSVKTALAISDMAGNALEQGGLRSPSGRRAIQALDKHLRSDSNQLNPGTTADLTAAAIMALLLRDKHNFLHGRGMESGA